MPMVDGKYARTFGTGYAAAKAAKQPPELSEERSDEAHQDPEGREKVMVEKHGDDDYTVHHKSGEKHEHMSHEEMKSHLDEHFGHEDSSEDEEHQGEGNEDEAGGDALKSILAE